MKIPPLFMLFLHLLHTPPPRLTTFEGLFPHTVGWISMPYTLLSMYFACPCGMAVTQTIHMYFPPHCTFTTPKVEKPKTKNTQSRPPNEKWGLFSFHFPGRTGNECKQKWNEIQALIKANKMMKRVQKQQMTSQPRTPTAVLIPTSQNNNSSANPNGMRIQSFNGASFMVGGVPRMVQMPNIQV